MPALITLVTKQHAVLLIVPVAFTASNGINLIRSGEIDRWTCNWVISMGWGGGAMPMLHAARGVSQIIRCMIMGSGVRFSR
jgi:hypothetical protein